MGLWCTCTLAQAQDPPAPEHGPQQDAAILEQEIKRQKEAREKEQAEQEQAEQEQAAQQGEEAPQDPEEDSQAATQDGAVDLFAVLGISQERLGSESGLSSVRLELQDREERLRQDLDDLRRRLHENLENSARLELIQEGQQAQAQEALALERARLEEAQAHKRRRPGKKEALGPEEEALLLRELGGGWELTPLDEALFALEETRFDLEARIAAGESDLSFLPEAEEQLGRLEADLKAKADQQRDVLSEQATRDREKAQQEKEETAEAKEETQQQLDKAEAERQAAQDTQKVLTRELEDLIQQEPRLLSETFYILDRRGNEFSLELEENSKRSTEFRADREKTLAQIEELGKKIAQRDDLEAQHAKAYKLFQDLEALRQSARRRILETAHPLPEVERLLEEAREDVQIQSKRVSAAREAFSADQGNEVRRKAYRVAEVEQERREAHLKLLKVRYQVLQSRYQQAHEELSFVREVQQELLPLLSDRALDGLYRLQDANFARASEEMVDLWLTARCHFKERWHRLVGSDYDGDGVDDVTLCRQSAEGEGGGAGLVDTLFLILKVLLLGAAALGVVRYVRRNRDSLFKRLADGVRRVHLSRGVNRFLNKLVEIGRVVVVPVVLLISLNLILGLFPSDDPLVVLIRVLLGSMLLYIIILGAIKTLILPRWYRARVEKEEGLDASEVVQHEGDILDLDLQRAQFIVSTLRMLLLYTLVCQYSLFLVRSALGMFFIAWWVHLLGYLGYVVIIYLLLSQWKDAIATQFERLQRQRIRLTRRQADSPEEAADAREEAVELPRAVSFVNTHKDRFYGVLVIFGAFVYVYALEAWLFVLRYGRGLESTQRLQNFLFRKQLELNNDGDDLKAEGKHEELPQGYRDLFVCKPLRDEPFLVSREQDVDRLHAAFERWRTEKGEGAWALVGEEGMGRSTVLMQLVKRWQGQHVVRMAALRPRVVTSQDMCALLSDLFELEAPLLEEDALMARLLLEPSRVIVLDDAENCFLRRIGGFEALKVLERAVRLGNQRHFWLLSFQNFAWAYVSRFGESDYPFCDCVKMTPWTHEELRALVEARSQASGHQLNYDRLKLDTGDSADFESVQSVRGYFRLLAEYSRGNPRVAMHYWLKSLTPAASGRLEVSLFRMGQPEGLAKMGERMKFVLAAVALHGCLSMEEVVEVNNIDRGFANLAVNYLSDLGFLEEEGDERRYRLKPYMMRQVLQTLLNNNFLYD